MAMAVDRRKRDLWQIGMARAVDRLSALPDNLLSLILSQLPIRDAIKSSILSKRWRYLHREMPDLILSPYDLTPTGYPFGLSYSLATRASLATVENIISEILRMHSSSLRSFTLCTGHSDPWPFSRPSLSEWLQCVARMNVERLILKYSFRNETPPAALFSCSPLTMLTLYSMDLTSFPTNFAGFKHLTECNFNDINITDDSLACFILHCPLLGKLNLQLCRGLQKPVISALNLTDLLIYEELLLYSAHGWTVNCPKLKTLWIPWGLKDLRVNGMAFDEFSQMIKRLQMDPGGNVFELSLRSCDYSCNYSSVNRFLELVGKLSSLKVLTIISGKKRMVIPLFNMLNRLPNLERLELYGRMYLEEAQGDPMASSLTYRLDNLQIVEMQPHKYDATELGLLGCLLQIAPALKDVILYHGDEDDHEAAQCNSFMENWKSLKKCHEQGTLTAKISEIGLYL